MPPKKRRAKKAKGKAVVAPAITTAHMLREREVCMQPRLGDVYTHAVSAESRRQTAASQRIRRAAQEQSGSLDLSRCSLHRCPEELSANSTFCERLTRLDLSKNDLYSLTCLCSHLCKLLQLQVLNLSRNCLNGPLPQCVGGLVALEEVNLEGNTITSLPNSVRKWQQLRRFYAASNRITQLPEETKAWVQLETLDMRNNGLTALPPDAVCQWGGLQTLLLSNNKLSEIPDSVGSLSQLAVLDLRANGLVCLPSTISSPSLRTLNAANNKITSVPAELCEALSNLKELYLFKNKIAALPAEIGVLTSCQRLSLSSNNIRELPDSIGSLTNLQELYLNDNPKLHALPSSMGQLHLLQALELRKCPALKNLPQTIGQLRTLRELDVRAPKKQVCKIAPEVANTLASHQCTIRGGIIKALRKAKSKKSNAKS